eukprot:6899600-Pyramimonas_sp.AAC.1
MLQNHVCLHVVGALGFEISAEPKVLPDLGMRARRRALAHFVPLLAGEILATAGARGRSRDFDMLARNPLGSM